MEQHVYTWTVASVSYHWAKRVAPVQTGHHLTWMSWYCWLSVKQQSITHKICICVVLINNW